MQKKNPKYYPYFQGKKLILLARIEKIKILCAHERGLMKYHMKNLKKEFDKLKAQYLQ